MSLLGLLRRVRVFEPYGSLGLKVNPGDTAVNPF